MGMPGVIGMNYGLYANTIVHLLRLPKSLDLLSSSSGARGDVREDYLSYSLNS